MKYSLKKCSTTYSSKLETIYWLHLKICLVIFPWKTTKQNHVLQVVIFLTKQLHITLKAKVNSLCFVSKLLVPPCLFLIFVFKNLEAGYAGKHSFVRKQISTQLLPFLFFQLEYLVSNPFFILISPMAWPVIFPFFDIREWLSDLLLLKVKENGFDQTLVYRRTGKLPHFTLCFWSVQPSFSQFFKN